MFINQAIKAVTMATKKRNGDCEVVILIASLFVTVPLALAVLSIMDNKRPKIIPTIAPLSKPDFSELSRANDQAKPAIAPNKVLTNK
jgi:hypothetical protein